MNMTSSHDISRIIEIYGNEYYLLDDDGNINLGSSQGSKEQVEEKIIFNKDADWPWKLFNESPEFIKAHTITNHQIKMGKKVMLAHVTYIAFWPGVFSIFYGDEVGAIGLGNIENRCPYPWNKRDKRLMKFFRNLGKVRTENEFLKYADIKLGNVTKYLASYERVGEKERIFVIVSRSRIRQMITVPKEYANGKVIFKLGYSNCYSLAPYGALVVKIDT